MLYLNLTCLFYSDSLPWPTATSLRMAEIPVESPAPLNLDQYRRVISFTSSQIGHESHLRQTLRVYGMTEYFFDRC